MENSNLKIKDLEENGFKLNFEDVINKAFENYKKIAIYAGLTILVFGTILLFMTSFGIVYFIGAENFDEKSIIEISKKMNNPESILLIIILTSLLSPIGAGFLKMAFCADKDENFEIKDFLYFYKWSYFKELVLATLLISFFSIGIKSVLENYKILFVGDFISILTNTITPLTIPLIIFKNLDALSALKTSINLSRQYLFLIFILLMVGFFGALVGLIGFIIGIVFTIPFSISMQYAIYDRIIGINTLEATKEENLIETDGNN